MSFLSMTKTLVKSLIHGPYTLMYPLKKKEVFQYTKGSIQIDAEKCIHCGLCGRGCPTGAIEVIKEDLSWSINRLACITCGYCSENCPVHCLTMDSHYSATTVSKVKDVFISARVSNNTENN